MASMEILTRAPRETSKSILEGISNANRIHRLIRMARNVQGSATGKSGAPR